MGHYSLLSPRVAVRSDHCQPGQSEQIRRVLCWTYLMMIRSSLIGLEGRPRMEMLSCLTTLSLEAWARALAALRAMRSAATCASCRHRPWEAVRCSPLIATTMKATRPADLGQRLEAVHQAGGHLIVKVSPSRPDHSLTSTIILRILRSRRVKQSHERHTILIRRDWICCPNDRWP
jgi:hypothetical protein